MTSNEDAAIQAANNLEKSVNSLRDEITNLRTFGRRNRHMIWGIVVCLVLIVALSAAVTAIAMKAVQASDQAVQASESATEANSLGARNRQTQIATCQAGNEARAANITLWNYVLDAVSKNNPNPSPQQTQQITNFKDYLKGVFAPRECSATAQGPVTSTAPSSTTRAPVSSPVPSSR